ncbi:MAG: DUF5686 family protein [Bacteroidota bacterium]
MSGHKTSILLFGLLFLGNILHSQSITYQGFISDENGHPLVFASVQVQSSTRGVFSDLDGNFSLSANPNDTLLISYVGYETKALVLGTNQQLSVQLQSAGLLLEEVIVRPEENPAWRIIRAAIARKDQHDPRQLEGYSYEAFHKTVLSVDSIQNPPRRQAKKAKEVTPRSLRRDSLRRLAQDKLEYRQDLFLNKMHVWVTETRSQHAFRAPNQHQENVIATQSSMPNDFTGGINPIDFQPFGFYQDLIRMEVTDQNYVNPLSKGTFRHYEFFLADTIVHAHDTTYIIQFWPQPKKSFVALKGLLFINTDGFAVENVIAEPADSTQTLQFVLQQQSKRVQGRWFPHQLNADIFLEMGAAGAYLAYGFRNRSVLQNVDLEPPPASQFNHYRKVVETREGAIADSLRLLPLNPREVNTYAYWDSLPELRPAYRMLKSYNGLIRVVSSGLWSGKTLDLVVPDLWRVNAVEGNRFGLGLKTNPRVSDYLSLYGYVAYGTRDRRWKYGMAAESILYRHRDLRLRFSYGNDLVEPGGVDYLTAVNNPWANWSARSLVLNRLDQQEFWRAEIIMRPKSSWQLNAYGSYNRRLLNYSYRYNEGSRQDDRAYELFRTGLGVRWSPKEQLVKMDQLEAILYPTFPIVDLNVEQLIFTPDNSLAHRISARLNHEQRWKYLGVSELVLHGGWLSKSVPYPFLFQAPGNNGNSITGNDVFNTAGPTEFANDYFAHLFLTHRFGPLLGRPKTVYFRPELRLIQQLGWGSLRQVQAHEGIELNDMRHLFIESGIGLDNIVRIPYFKALYLGLGGSLWYRWGAYHLPNTRDNFRFQITLNLSI